MTVPESIVTTSLRNAEDERVIGTALDHKHPAYALMLEDKPYTGRARLFGRDYMTHYEPLQDAEGSTVGILFVGQNAALEVVVAVGGGKGHAGLDDRTKETGERAADLFAGLIHEFVEGRRRLVCGAGLAGLR